MIKLFGVKVSHFVEKVCWALDYKQLDWEFVNVDPFTKQEMRGLEVERIENNGYKILSFPTLHDTATDTVLGDSTPILEYLEDTYPDTPMLFPSNAESRAELKRLLLRLDSELGAAARRIGYLQLLLEIPQVIARYFLPSSRPGGLKSWLAQVFVFGMLAQRFRLTELKQDKTFEKTLALLLPFAERLVDRPFVFGDEFSAADITLAALARPLRVVPFFREHENLKPLFAWQEKLFAEHKREAQLYETTMLARRLAKGYCKSAGWLHDNVEIPPLESKEYEVAVNDQRYTGRKQVLFAPFFYLRLRHATNTNRLRVES